MTNKLQEHKMSDNLNELFEALAQAQGEFHPVQCDKKVDFKTKTNNRVKYNYASFAAIMQMAQKPLATYGLSVFQTTAENNLITTLAHKSGQAITSTIPLPSANDIKQLGANLSYLRRYQYTSIIGAIVSDEDNEEVVGGKVTEEKPKAAAPQHKPAKTSPAPGFPAMVAEVNKELGKDHYNVYRAQNAIKQVIDDFQIPAPDDTEALAGAKQILLDHANAPG